MQDQMYNLPPQTWSPFSSITPIPIFDAGNIGVNVITSFSLIFHIQHPINSYIIYCLTPIQISSPMWT